MQKRIILIGLSILLLLTIIIVIYKNRFVFKYKNVGSIVQLEGYKTIADYQAKSIILKKAYDDADWVVISDESMINEMTEYLLNLVISFDDNLYTKNMMGGGGLVTTYKIGENSFTISYNKTTNQIVIKDGNYEIIFDIISKSMENPFERLYQEGLEKFGITRPWK